MTENTTTTTTAAVATKKAAKKAAGAKAATKKAAKKGAKKGAAVKKAAGGGKEKKGELSGNAIKVLQAMKGTAANGKTVTRAQLAEKTGINKGWSKLLGNPTKGGDHGMEAAGLVKSQKHEGERGLVYFITEKGRKALEAAK